LLEKKTPLWDIASDIEHSVESVVVKIRWACMLLESRKKIHRFQQHQRKYQRKWLALTLENSALQVKDDRYPLPV
jgi:hypothetical protein